MIAGVQWRACGRSSVGRMVRQFMKQVMFPTASSGKGAADPSLRFVLPEPSALPKNLAALWAVDPVLARRIEAILDEPAYPVEPSKAGPTTLAMESPDGKRIYLHSRHQPVD